MRKSYAIPWNVNCVRPFYTRSTLRNIRAAYTRRRHRASESIYVFHSDSSILTLSFFARSSTYSDNDCTEKAMLLIDVCFGEQTSLARHEIPPEGVKDYDTVSGYRLTSCPGCISLLYIYCLRQVQILKRSLNGQSSPVDDVIVCKKNAIRPSYLVFYG